MIDPSAWLAARTPPPPEALVPSVAAAGDDLVGALAEAGLEHLERAVRGEGERRGAFELLAADALLTYACEAALEADDPEAALLSILERVERRSG